VHTHPDDNRPPSRAPLARVRVTRTRESPTVDCVPATWPIEEFNAYLRALMDRAQIADYAELSRLTGVSQTQFSNWRRGLTQPGRRSLKRIAPALGLKGAVTLYLAAGLDEQEDLELAAAPDFTVLPKPFQDLLEVYEELRTLGQEEVAISSIRVVVAGLRAQLPDTRKGQPSGQRRKAG
jgi:transcriptional regulator with XRE-family HTH domain